MIPLDGFSNSVDNASVRGYIMRSLVKGHRFSCSVKSLSNKMLSCGLISNPDISNHLYYLKQCHLIEFSGKSDAFNAMDNDAVVRLTAEGIRFIENGGNPGMGIDL